MNKSFSANATDLIANFGNAAHHAIGVYREGGERLAGTLEQRWKAALKETSPKLTPETRKNAARAQEAFSGYYARGLALSADGAEVVIDTLVGAAVTAIERAAAFKARTQNAA
ncbi:hypothetical protein [Caenimonas soli]|uniref:hypothetical protein n=1 Tax=Caenimonas soli TaxID=2735555 RepID=UPI00155447EF|nr:hypothetical protein [Caenimonas soli]NPC56297.1 hypothetical protein [Caenimonas soli]